MPARADVTGNIERLAARVSASPGSTRLFALVEAELAEGSAGSSRSCTKGLLWLKRFLEFTVRLLERLGREPEAELGVCASAAYAATLAPFHGYLTTALFTVVLHAVPSRASFERAIVERFQQRPGTEPDSKALAVELGQFAARFTPVLARIHLYLADAGLCVTAARRASSLPLTHSAGTTRHPSE